MDFLKLLFNFLVFIYEKFCLKKLKMFDLIKNIVLLFYIVLLICKIKMIEELRLIVEDFF